MCFLELKKWVLPSIAIILCFFFLMQYEQKRIERYDKQIKYLTHKNHRPQVFSKERLKVSLMKSYFCGYHANIFYILRFKKNGKMDIWMNTLRGTSKVSPYPPKIMPTAKAFYHIRDGLLLWEHSLFGYPLRFKLFPYSNEGETTFFLAGPQSFFSPELCNML